MTIKIATAEEELLDHLEYIMSCVSEDILGEAKYELEKLIQAIINAPSLTQDQKNDTEEKLGIIEDLLHSNSPNLKNINNLFWKLHKNFRGITHDAIRKSCAENIT